MYKNISSIYELVKLYENGKIIGMSDDVKKVLGLALIYKDIKDANYDLLNDIVRGFTMARPIVDMDGDEVGVYVDSQIPMGHLFELNQNWENRESAIKAAREDKEKANKDNKKIGKQHKNKPNKCEKDDGRNN